MQRRASFLSRGIRRLSSKEWFRGADHAIEGASDIKGTHGCQRYAHARLGGEIPFFAATVLSSIETSDLDEDAFSIKGPQQEQAEQDY